MVLFSDLHRHAALYSILRHFQLLVRKNTKGDARARARTHTHTHTYMHMYIHPYTHIYTHIHTYTNARAHTHTHTHTHTHARACVCVCVCAYTRAYTCNTPTPQKTKHAHPRYTRPCWFKNDWHISLFCTLLVKLFIWLARGIVFIHLAGFLRTFVFRKEINALCK